MISLVSGATLLFSSVHTATGNNSLATTWRPSELPSKQRRSRIDFSGGPGVNALGASLSPRGKQVTGGKRRSTNTTTTTTTTTTARARAAVGVRKKRPDCRRRGTGGNNGTGGESGRSPLAAAKTARNERKPPQRRRGMTAVRRPWGAGPGRVNTHAAASDSRDYYRPWVKASRSVRGGSKVTKEGSGGEHSQGVKHSHTSGRARISHMPPPSPSPPVETSRLGPTALQQYLPTWSALVAEAVWLRGSAAAVASDSVIVDGDGDSVGDVSGCGGGGGGGGHSSSSADRFHPPSDNKVSFSRGLSGRVTGEEVEFADESNGSALGQQAGPRAVGGQWRSDGEQGGVVSGRHHGCVPAPSLDPNVERLLMDWIQSRVDR